MEHLILTICQCRFYMIFKKQFEWNSHIKRLLSYLKSFVNDSCGLKIFDLDYIISQVSTVDTTVSEGAVIHLMNKDTSFTGDNVRLIDHTYYNLD